MIIKQIVCNRCGDEIEGAYPPQLVKQTWVKSEKVTIANGYRNTDKIHLCEKCSKAFEEFMEFKR